MLTRVRMALAGASFAALVAFGVPTANAATVLCPNTADPLDREFGVDTTPNSSCFDYGDGNINGNPGGGNPDPILTGNPGLVLIDKSDISDPTKEALDGALSLVVNAGGLSGTFSIVAPGFTGLILALKSGDNISPAWAAFSLGALTGSWTISQNALSHANLYGVASVVPIPPAALLFGTGLAALGLIGMRRRRSRSPQSLPGAAS